MGVASDKLTVPIEAAPQRARLSVVLPAYNEAESLEELYSEIETALGDSGYEFEVVIVDDGSVDDTPAVVDRLIDQHPGRICAVQLRRNFGKSVALMEGFRAASGDLIVMMDADLQDVPGEMPKLLEALELGYDAVSGWKQNRKDRLVKRLSSRVFNAAVNRISIAQLHDHDCGYKVLRAEAARSLDLYGSLYRFMIPLLEEQGYRATEVPVAHRRRAHGRSRYGLSRFFQGAFDYVTVVFITRFRHRPFHFFGYVGMSAALIGFAIGFYLTLYKFIGHHSIGTRPLLWLAVLLIIVGVQIATTGIIGEQIIALLGGRRQMRTTVRSVRGDAGRADQLVRNDADQT